MKTGRGEEAWPVIIVPAFNEEECLPAVIREIQREVPGWPVIIGANACTDATTKCARALGASVAETAERGYGHGCVAAINLADLLFPRAPAYLFVAGDGANDPRDAWRLYQSFQQGFEVVLGTRTRTATNYRSMGFSHLLANRALGVWCGCLTGRFFSDLGPLRLIDKKVYHQLALQELTFGWTIEAQIKTARLGAKIVEVDVRERTRLAGQQKVSRIGWMRSLRIGAAIFQAGWRSRFAPLGVDRSTSGGAGTEGLRAGVATREPAATGI
jgi:glycosyltransferase involved in cell wall biosynthesis